VITSVSKVTAPFRASTLPSTFTPVVTVMDVRESLTSLFSTHGLRRASSLQMSLVEINLL
jgi:hypothetical protein